jgi:hypothetical protein
MKHLIHFLLCFAAVTCMTAFNLLKASPFGAAPLCLNFAAATEDIDTDSRPGDTVALPVKAAISIFAGTLVAIDAAGWAVPASDTANLKVVGRCREAVDNSAGANGDLKVVVEKGVFHFSNSGSSAVAQANVGATCVVEDDNTVALDTTNDIVAGLVVEVDANGVWVDTRRFAAA